jgi:recombinational DNA repair protein (RecF pathway)
MQEFVSDAIVLRKDPQGDLDGRYVFFTERFGKVVAKAKSSRKITSKLASHLEPGTIGKIRFIENHSTQIIDALKARKSGVAIADLSFLSQLLHELQPEPELWEMLFGGGVDGGASTAGTALAPNFSWAKTLAVLGWDPHEAVCFSCGKARPAYFYVPRQEFFCADCVKKLPLKLRGNAVLSIYAL